MIEYPRFSIVRLSETAQLPVRATKGSIGYDLFADNEEEITIGHGTIKLIPLGFAIRNNDVNFEFQIRSRSGLASKGITVVNAPATIDYDYTGEVKVILGNFSGASFTVKRGDRIAQAVVSRVGRFTYDEVDSFEVTERGAGGFGSTGITNPVRSALDDAFGMHQDD